MLQQVEIPKKWLLWCNRDSGQYLCNFHAWHEKLLPAARAAHESSDKMTAQPCSD